MKKLIAMAAEAAALAPEHLQEAAFNRAFELLSAGPSNPAAVDSTKRRSAKSARLQADSGHSDDSALDGLDRTAHPEIRHSDTALLNALRLLSAAKEDLGIDGLSAATIAKVLVDKFRSRVTRQAVSMALNRAGRYVNRHREGGTVIFRLMGPGEEHVKSVQAGGSGSEPTGVRRGPLTKPKARSVASKTDKRSASKKTGTSPQGQAGRSKERVGAWTATMRLLAEEFFSESRTIGAIVAHMKEEQGRQYKANEVSPALLRLLRDRKLVRSKNANGQYEYRSR